MHIRYGGRIRQWVFLLSLGAGAASAQTSYETTLLLQGTPSSLPNLTDNITRVVYKWSTTTTRTSGGVGTGDLSALTMDLWNATSLVYTDAIIAGGVVQPIGGASRPAADVSWDFDIGTLTLAQMRNVLSGTLSAASGTQFVVQDGATLPTDGQVGIAAYINGSPFSGSTRILASQNTVVTSVGSGGLPTIAGLDPLSVTAGAPSFLLTVAGTNFCSQSLIEWAGRTLPTSFVSSTMVRATVAVSLVASPQTVPIRVLNPSASGCSAGGSNVVTFSVSGVVSGQPPVITSFDPATVAAGSGAFTLTINGSGFCPSALLDWGGSTLAGVVTGSSRLVVSITGELVATARTVSFRVINPPATGCSPGNSTPATFVVAGGTSGPSITSLSPSTALAGSGALSVAIIGANFCAQSTVDWGGVYLPAAFVSSTSLLVTVPAPLVTSAASVPVRVVNPGASGCVAGTSTAATFTISVAAAQPPSITSLTPASVTAGDPAFVLVVAGANFCSQSAVQWNGSPLDTTVTSSSSLSVNVPPSLTSAAGVATIRVSNPNAGTCSPGGLSNALELRINAPALPPPVISELTPTSVAAGATGLTLTVTGTNFCSQSVVQWNGTPLATVFGTASRVTATVPAALTASIGTATIRVVNPSSVQCGAGGTSNTLSFSVTAAPQIGTIEPTTVRLTSTVGRGIVTATLFVPALSAPAQFSVVLESISGGNWLTITPMSGNSPASLTFSANSGAVPAGIYTATAAVNSSGRTQRIQVTFVVTTVTSEQPVFVVPETVEVSYRTNSGTVIQPISVGAVRPDESFRAEAQVISPAGRNWLSVQQTGPGTLNARIDTNQLPSTGVYLARIIYRRNSASRNSGEVRAAQNATERTTDPATCLAAAAKDKIGEADGMLATPKNLSYVTSGDAASAPPTLLTVSSTTGNGFNFDAQFTPCDDIDQWLRMTDEESGIESSAITGAIAPRSFGTSVRTAGLPQRQYRGKLVLTQQDGRGQVLDADVVVGDALQVGAPGQEQITVPAGQGPASSFLADTSGSELVSPQQSPQQSPIAYKIPVRTFSNSPTAVALRLITQPEDGAWARLGEEGLITTPAEATLLVDSSKLTPGKTYSAFVLAENAQFTGSAVLSVTAVSASTRLPVIEEVTNAATLRTGSLAPGTLFSIKGRNLMDDLGASSSCGVPAIRLCLSGGVPVQNSLSELQVLLNGKSVPLLFAGRVVLDSGVTYDQINAVTPWGLTGPDVRVQVKRKDLVSAAVPVRVQAAAPGIFTAQSSGTGQGIATLGNTRLLAAPEGTVPGWRPARLGETIVLWTTGLGKVGRPADDGVPVGVPIAPNNIVIPFILDQQKLVETPTVLIGGRPAQVAFAGIAPGFVGLYQVNVVVPRDVTPGGRVPVQIRIDNNIVTRDDVTIAVSSETVP